jgi:hypothetical protein
MKRFVVLIIAAVLVGGAIGSAFIGGVAIGKDQGKEEATQDLQSRVGQFSGRFNQDATGSTDQSSGFTPPSGTGTFIGRGGTIGTIEKIEGNIITLKTVNGKSVSVVTSSDTTFQKMTSGSVKDLKTGDNITVSGETKDDGTVQATNVFMTPIMTIQQQP